MVISTEFERIVARFPENIAVTQGNKNLTYHTLSERVTALSHALPHQADCQFVITLMEESISLVMAALAIMKADNVFVPLSPKLPEQRLATLLAQFKGATIITCRQWLPLVEHLQADYALVLADDILADDIREDHVLPAGQGSSQPISTYDISTRDISTHKNRLAYVYFTSGSTGQPKAILGRSDSLLHFIRWESRELNITAADKVSQLIPQMFDPFLRDIFLPLLNGATLCIPPAHDIRYSPHELLDWMREQQISITHQIPSFFQVLLECRQSADDLQSLRYAVLSGEMLKGPLVELFYQRRLKQAQLINMYGTTETTLARVYHRVTEKDAQSALIPAGKPIDDTTIMIVDEQGESVPAGSVGEIWISTPFMSAGYLLPQTDVPQTEALQAEASQAEAAPTKNTLRFITPEKGALAGQPVYRTGDVGRMDEQGNLILLGRNDFQVKINGQRLETAEIESLLEQHPAVQQAVVQAFEQPQGIRLVAFIRLAPSMRVTAKTLNIYLAPHLSAAMRPDDYQFLSMFPLLPNDKIDRKALQALVDRQASLNRSSHNQFAQERGNILAPQGERETKLSAVWQALLHIEPIGRDDSFFALGGDSLQAIRMIAQVRQQMGLNLKFGDLFQHPTLAQCAAMLSATEMSAAEKGVEEFALTPHSASYEQQGIYLLQQTIASSPIYNMAYVAQWQGALDHDRLQQSLEALFACYDVLRTGFLTQEGHVIAQVAEQISSDIIWQDLSQYGAQAQSQAENMISQFASLPFDLAQPPLLRVAGLTLRPHTHLIVLVFHHLIVDEESVKRLWDGLLENYSRLQMGKASDIQPVHYGQREHAAFQHQRINGPTGMAARQYWQRQLAGPLPLIQLPYDFPTPAMRSYQGGQLPFSLPTAFSEQVDALACHYGITPQLILQAGFIAFLACYSRQNDILLGTPVSNRQHNQEQQSVGLLFNVLVMRNQVDISQSFEQLLAQVKSTFIDAIEHQDMPFSQLLPLLQQSALQQSTLQQNSGEEIHHPGISPVFQTLFTYQNTPASEKRMGSIQLSPLRQWSIPIAKYELTLEMWREKDELQGVLGYASDRFLPETISRMAENFCHFLPQLLNEPQQAIGRVSLLSPAQWQQLQEWNQTDKPFSDNIGIHQLIERQVQRDPDAVAVEFGEQTLTYAELDQQANQLAHFLIQQGVGTGVCVGLSVDRSLEAVVCFLAILKAGGAYVPMDPHYPLERNRYVIENARLRLLITQDQFMAGYQDCEVFLFSLEALLPQLNTFSTEKPQVDIPPESTAYIIYTSGSTGKPKGVPICHRSACNLAEAEIEYLAIPPDSRVLQFASFSFDVSIWEFFMALCSGSVLLMAPRLALMPGPDLLEQLITRRVTHITLPPSTLAVLPETDLPDLQVLMVSGEACGIDLVRKWGKNRRFINAYGPTEATVGTSNADLTPEDTLVHIGRPIPNFQVWILDEYGAPLPIGVAGELCVGGVGVSEGYLNRPELTERSFVPDPFSAQPGARLYRTGDLAHYQADGNLVYLGRMDQQVKIRGYRVELGEIESALRRHPAISGAVAMVRKDYLNASAIVAYLLTQSDTSIDESQIESHLKAFLPDFMLPSCYVFLREFPRLPNNKVDRKRFPTPMRQADEIVIEPAHNETEQAIIHVWQTLLGHQAIGRNTSFFAAGGHSLLAARMVAILASQYQLNFKVSDVFTCRTPMKLAERVSPATTQILLNLPTIHDAPLSFAQHRMWFLDQLYPDSSRYHIINIKTFPDEIETARMQQSINLLFRRYPMLNLRLRMEGDTPRQYYSDQPPHCVHEIIDVRDKQEWQQQLQQRAARMMATPFRLIGEPLSRLLLVTDARQGTALIFCLHHILVDEQSLGQLDDELMSLYQWGENAPQISAPDYLQFATWERSAEVQQEWRSQLDYWRGVYHSLPPMVRLPQKGNGNVVAEDATAAYHYLPLSIEQTAALRQLAQQQDTTLFTLLLAAFQILLQRYSSEGADSGDIVIGIPVSLRDRPELQSVVGLLLNTLALRQNVDITLPFTEFLANSAQTLNQAMANKDLPFEQVVDAVMPAGKRSLSPLFQIMFVFNAFRQQTDSRLREQSHEQSINNSEAKFDLTLFVQETENSLQLRIEYREACFAEEMVAQLMAHYAQLLDSVITASNQFIYQLDLLSPQERQHQINNLNNTEKRLLHPVVHQWFEQQVRKTPQAIALNALSGTGHVLSHNPLSHNPLSHNPLSHNPLSYHQLNQQANRLAKELLEQGIGAGSRVGICLPRSAMLITAILAVMKTGAAYVPMDTAYPVNRISFMLEDAQVARVITTDEQATRLGLPKHHVILLTAEQLTKQLTKQLAEPLTDNPDTIADPEITISPEQPAYILYTSGSTGKPKGVIIPHRGLGNYLQHACEHYADPSKQGNTLHASVSFDATITSLFLPLLQGQTLFILPEGEDIPALVQAWQQLPNLAMAKITPAHLELLSQQLPSESLGRIPLLVIGGESLSASALRFWRQHAPQVRIINEYGPTETTVGCCIYDIPAGDIDGEGVLPIGRPIANTQLYLLDECQQLVPFGAVGELYIGGMGVGLGYFNRPDMTENRFIADPFATARQAKLYRTGDLARYLPDGNLLFLGRRDQQIKLHGYRIELEEVEAQLTACQGISQAAVGLRDIHGRQHLVAYVVMNQPAVNEAAADADMDRIRRELSQRLPEHMCPTQWIMQETLPLTGNGKIDRKELAQIPLAEKPRMPTHRTAVTVLEKQLTEIWQQVLDQENLGIDDDFFVLGGDSILSLQIVFRAREMGLRITPKMLFDYPTIAALAAVVMPMVIADDKTQPVQGEYALLPIQRWLFEQHHANPHHYNLSYLYALEAGTDIPVLTQALVLLINQHDGLRSRFPLTGKHAQKYAQIDAPVAAWQIEQVHIKENPANEALLQAAAERQAQLNIENGPLLTATHFTTAAGDYLLLTVHHLVVDGVSWRIITEDLTHYYRTLLAGETPRLATKSASLIEWASHLADYAQSGLAQHERHFWQQKLHCSVPSLPCDRGEKPFPGLVKESAKYRLMLDIADTTALVQHTGQAYRTHTGDLLLSALVATLQRWSGSGRLHVDMEGHGRESLHETVDVSRTVGWFTAIYPLLLDLPASCPPEQLIPMVKEAVRQVPYSGAGYGALRAFSDMSGMNSLPDFPSADICFNYLGQFTRSFHQTPLSGVADMVREHRHAPDNFRQYALEVDSYIDEGQLQIEWTYNRQCYQDETIDKLATAMKEQIIRLTEHCMAQQQTTYTPSDFPLARLNPETLHQLQQRYGVMEDIFPLTYTQEGMLFHSMAEQGSGLYHEQLCFNLPQDVNIARLQQAWQRVVAYYPILRSRFELSLADEPLQVIMPHQTPEWRQHDLRLHQPTEAEQHRQNLLSADLAEEFVLNHDVLTHNVLNHDVLNPNKLYRFTVLQLPDEQTQLIFSHHHAILDGWSVRLILTTVEAIYHRPDDVLLPAPAFKSFIRWQQQNRKTCQDYWQARLADVTSATPLPAAHPVRTASQLKQRHAFCLSAELSRQLAETGRDYRLTLSTLVQGAWALLLQRYSQQDECLFGMTVSGRQADLAGIDKMVGLLISTLPIHITSHAGQTVADWLGTIQQQLREHEKFSAVSLADLKSACNLPAFDTLLVFENYPQPSGLKEKLFEFEQATESTNYPLTLVTAFSDRLHGELVYDTGLYDESVVGRLAGHFTGILTRLMNNMTGMLNDIALLDEQEKQQLLTQWQGPELPIFTGNVYSLFDRQVQRSPQQIAVVDGQNQISYAELAQRIEHICHCLHHDQISSGDRVALYLPRSPDYIAAMLAVSRMGACYVPIDTSYPAERVTYLLSDSQSRLVVTHQALAANFAPDIAVRVLDKETDPVPTCSLPPFSCELNSDDANALAYLIYTSGSTGMPKGVMIEHLSLINYLTDASQRYQVSADTQSLLHSSVSFDATLTSLYLPLLHGGTITVIQDDAGIALMAEALQQQDNQLLKITPAYLGLLGEYLNAQAKSHVKSLVIGGDALNCETVQAWLSEAPELGVFNEYGPTETVVGCCVHRADRAQDLQGMMPIGLPIANTRLFVLNDDLSPTPFGMAGELYIGGLGVARGYWDRPELTAEKFITLSEPNGEIRAYRTGDRVCALPNGELLYLGRYDRQIKLRGYRIEPGEIEAQLMQHPHVQQSALIPYSDEQGEMRLVACVALKSTAKADISSETLSLETVWSETLRDFLSRHLPVHMLPHAIVLLDEMPQTTNGKVDHAALLALLPEHLSVLRQQEQHSLSKPQTPLEKRLGGIWCDVLQREDIGCDQNFFSLGGHSLHALRIAARIEQQLSVRISLAEFLRHQTITQLARLLEPRVTAENPVRYGTIKRVVRGM
ncbi:amino acid adenylation domain-containing protein [Xenorhabdus sp. Reich]|uniref:Amino acid adenylation domain-containing protein n=1 Tax=Xenorhabdus littoralis TaxID=2582835 RepID=A0ABU4SLN6_9GAMM|nr:non-ribosomal peptide synthetase [Xenorhabdus sp. Reich]MDX7999530.1 amino acid adenylation domain-containing protein [Xenorhabdus sp. Reich]